MIRNCARIAGLFACWVSTAAVVAAESPADFTIHGIDGKSFSLSEARGKFVALHFLLRTECPVCANVVRTYVTQGPRVAGVIHVFLKPDSEAEIRAWLEKMPLAERANVAICRDADASLAKRFNIPDDYVFHDEKMHYPALVLLGPDGREVFRHVGKDTRDRLPFDAFAKKIADLSQNSATREYNLKSGNLAVDGYDPVSYFAGEPLKGDASLISIHRGVAYHFASAENRAKFAADPDRFVPAYGGWCATAMGEGGRKVEIDPVNYKIANGRLLLFYKGWRGDALKEWNKDEAKWFPLADQHWARIAAGDVPAARQP